MRQNPIMAISEHARKKHASIQVPIATIEKKLNHLRKDSVVMWVA